MLLEVPVPAIPVIRLAWPWPVYDTIGFLLWVPELERTILVGKQVWEIGRWVGWVGWVGWGFVGRFLFLNYESP